jgi:hypothetical protein
LAAGFAGTLSLGRNAASGAVGNINLPATGYRFFQNTTGNSSALPASINLSADTASPAAFWAAVS